MPGRFNIPGTHGTVGSAAKTVVQMKQGATPRSRPVLIGYVLGFNGTPADNAMLSDIVRCDATGAGTAGAAVTPTPMDAGDVASNLTGNEGFTAEPTTVGVTILEIPQHQRTTVVMQWAEENGAVLTGTASHSLLGRTLHASYTGACSATFSYRE